MRRREFLSTVGIGAGALLADGLRSRRSAHAAEWGTYPAAHRAFEVPASRRPQAVLETFLFGGLSPWETFYVVDEPEYGRATQEMWWTFQEGEDNVSEVWSRCRPAGDRPLLVDFARDERGAMVKLGPFIDPIRRRPDLLERMRVHVLSHDLAPHMLAIPYALTGHHFGDPRLAGVGTVVQRYFQSRGEDRGRPVSYLIRPLERNPLFGAASDVGLHPSSARPLTLHVGADRQFVDALQRRSLGSQADAADALTRHYLQQFKRRLTPASLGRAVRSRAFDEFEHSAQLVQGARGLVDAFPAEALALAPGEACGEREPEAESLTQLRLAARLIKHSGARHVTVADYGLVAPYDHGYDTHRHHVRVSFINLTYFLQCLVAVINAPGENDPDKIDLDRTLVVINMEFGRTPGRQTEHPTGRNHYPGGYVTVMFGGPIGPAQRGIVGSLGPDGRARNGLVPTDTRAAILAALGIYPMDRDVFAVGNFPGSRTDEEILERAVHRVLGLP